MPVEKRGSSNNAVERPHSSLVKQQRLPAWQPILTPPHVSACFLLTTAIFIPIGVAILQANDKVVELEFQYDQIRHCTPRNNDNLFNYKVGNQTTSMGCVTQVTFDVPARMEAPVYLYYKLSSFYQNHRRYQQSRLDVQLCGEPTPSSTSDADPFAIVGDAKGLRAKSLTVDGVNTTYSQFLYSPAGLIAWSMFNDSFTLYRYLGSNPDSNSPKLVVCNGSAFSRFDNQPLSGAFNASSCHKKGIAWSSDVADKFKIPNMAWNIWTAPRSIYGATPLASNDPYYTNGWYTGEAGHVVPVVTDEDFMVWMRTSSLPEFRKLYRVIDVALDVGTYVMEITEQYDVSSFGGTKSFALTTLSWVGGKNPFLGTIFLILGCAAFVGAVVFAAIHHSCGDRTQRAIDELLHDSR